MLKVIVADDEPTHLEMVATILERAGHDVVAVNSGLGCLHSPSLSLVDLVVADIFMPDLDGLKLMAELRARGNFVPVIGMTGGMKGRLAPFIDLMSQLGAVRVLIKPFSGTELLQAVQTAIKDKTGHE